MSFLCPLKWIVNVYYGASAVAYIVYYGASAVGYIVYYGVTICSRKYNDKAYLYRYKLCLRLPIAAIFYGAIAVVDVEYVLLIVFVMCNVDFVPDAKFRFTV